MDPNDENVSKENLFQAVVKRNSVPHSQTVDSTVGVCFSATHPFLVSQSDKTKVSWKEKQLPVENNDQKHDVNEDDGEDDNNLDDYRFFKINLDNQSRKDGQIGDNKPQIDVTTTSRDSSSLAQDHDLPYSAPLDSLPSKRILAQAEGESQSKKHRKSYSDIDKQRIIKADLDGGRQQYAIVAQALDMPIRTADAIVRKARYGLPGADHDRRHDMNETGRPTKLSERIKELLLEWIHNEPTLTLGQLLQYVNHDILKQVLEELKVPVQGNDAKRGFPIDENEFAKYLENDDVKKKYEKLRVKSTQTITNWLDGLLITKKHVVTEKISANTKANMSKRLAFAKSLTDILFDPGNYMVFIDETPWYLSGHTIHGRAKKGERAVVKTLPLSEFSLRTQVALAVNPQSGIICYEIASPKKLPSRRKDGTAGRLTFRACWNKDEFKNFLNLIIVSLLKRKQDISGKTVMLIMDGAPEHGKNDEMDTMMNSLQAFEEFRMFCKETSTDILAIKMPPNSPQLNLCEYYNRTLRTQANKLRHEQLISNTMLDNDIEHGKKLEHRINVMREILITTLTSMQEKVQTKSFSTMIGFVHDVIQHDGYLDFHKPM